VGGEAEPRGQGHYSACNLSLCISPNHRMCNPGSEPQCELWTLGDSDSEGS
jgi:hypothetical protein